MKDEKPLRRETPRKKKPIWKRTWLYVGGVIIGLVVFAFWDGDDFLTHLPEEAEIVVRLRDAGGALEELKKTEAGKDVLRRLGMSKSGDLLRGEMRERLLRWFERDLLIIKTGEDRPEAVVFLAKIGPVLKMADIFGLAPEGSERRLLGDFAYRTAETSQGNLCYKRLGRTLIVARDPERLAKVASTRRDPALAGFIEGPMPARSVRIVVNNAKGPEGGPLSRWLKLDENETRRRKPLEVAARSLKRIGVELLLGRQMRGRYKVALSNEARSSLKAPESSHEYKFESLSPVPPDVLMAFSVRGDDSLADIFSGQKRSATAFLPRKMNDVLEDIEDITGLTPEELARRHLGREATVALSELSFSEENVKINLIISFDDGRLTPLVKLYQTSLLFQKAKRGRIVETTGASGERIYYLSGKRGLSEEPSFCHIETLDLLASDRQVLARAVEAKYSGRNLANFQPMKGITGRARAVLYLNGEEISRAKEEILKLVEKKKWLDEAEIEDVLRPTLEGLSRLKVAAVTTRFDGEYLRGRLYIELE